MQVKINEVHTFKLASGEEMVAKVTAQQEHWITVSEPVTVAPGPQGMGLIPGLFTADHGQDISINIQNCSLVAVTDNSVKAKYIEATTGLRVPDKKLVLG